MSSISQQRFAVVDTETSGLDVDRDRVVQVGVVVVDGSGHVLDRWSSLVAPKSRWWFRVGPTHIHGITRRALRAAPPARDTMLELARRLEGARFVAHNAPFDLKFLAKASSEHQVPLPIEQPVCTLRLSRALDRERTRSHRLEDLCARYGITLVNAHDALADAEATAELLPHLLREHGYTDTDQLPSL